MAISEDALKGAEIMQDFINTVEKLGHTPKSLTSLSNSLGKLTLLAHQDPTVVPTSNKDIEELIPLLTSSLRQNAAIEESLALLLTFTCSSNDILPQEIVDPLATILTPVAAAHSDPTMRHISFRILSSILARCPPPLRLAHLTSLLSDCPFTQMRVAAIGLVKEAFLSASSSTSSSLFNSPSLIRAIGPILFRPDPPDAFENPSSKTLEKIIETSESVRLTECLSFYYVWLMCDTRNSTGIRDHDRIKTIENGLLGPLRHALAAWSVEPHILMTIASLQTSVERVDDAISSIVV
ncbi:hypothetical protein Clacol_004577 [Clathrus columnatus]|uniref:Uncharacterized protein n=1 Tax=Clathrus columnatus TaxID=1419009 RepID=A0AAV5A6U7_9AGAM|nr:hypothetical protein Clacol_004577 [Clathrus columnatus]